MITLKPGMVVSVTTRHLNYKFDADDEYETAIYTGTVMRNDKWLKEHVFCLSNPSRRHPMRVINYRNVIDIHEIKEDAE